MRRRIPLIGSACVVLLLSMPAMAADVKQSSSVATSNTVDSPSIGYVTRLSGDNVLELRAMLGIPGAARFSDPITLPDGTSAAEVAPGHQWVLAVRTSDVAAYLPATGAAVTLAAGVPAAWAFSPSGSRAALFFPDRGEVAMVSGLPASAKLDNTLKIGQMDSFAVSDNGTLVYALAGQVLDSGGGLLYGSSGPLAFESGRDLLILFDGSTSSLVELAPADGSTRVVTSGLAAAPDTLFAGSDRIYAGNSAAGTVSLIEYADGSVASQNVTVARIAPTAITGTVVVSVVADGPAWLVNAQGVSFIPAVVKQSVQ